RRRLAARHRDDGGTAEDELRPQEGRFERGCVLVIADEAVCEVERELVERARERDSHVVITGAACGLDAGGEPGLDHVNCHGAPTKCRLYPAGSLWNAFSENATGRTVRLKVPASTAATSRSYSSREIGFHLTMSPGRKNAMKSLR